MTKDPFHKTDWNKVRRIALAFVIIYLAVLAFVGLGCASDQAVYPDPETGLTRWETFKTVAGFVSLVFAVPLIGDIALIIVSVIKIAKDHTIPEGEKPKNKPMLRTEHDLDDPLG